jgi:hypothetical protein
VWAEIQLGSFELHVQKAGCVDRVEILSFGLQCIWYLQSRTGGTNSVGAGFRLQCRRVRACGQKYSWVRRLDYVYRKQAVWTG